MASLKFCSDKNKADENDSLAKEKKKLKKLILLSLKVNHGIKDVTRLGLWGSS